MNKEEALRTRTIPFVFSDESRDSHGTVLPISGWVLDRYNKNGVVFYMHDKSTPDPNLVIGTAKVRVENDELVGEITFEKGETNPLAEKVFQKYMSGTFKGVSVGFIPLERGYWGKGDEAMGEVNETYYFGKRELVELSATPLPSNKNALVRSMGQEPTEDSYEKMTIDGYIRVIETEIIQEEKEDDKKSDKTLLSRSIVAEAEAMLALSKC